MAHDPQPHDRARRVMEIFIAWTFILGGVVICGAWQFANAVFRPLGIIPTSVTEHLLTLCDLHLGYAAVVFGVYWRLKERYAWRGHRSRLMLSLGWFAALLLIAFLVLALGSPWVLRTQPLGSH